MTSELLGKLLRVQQNMPSIFKTEVNNHFGNKYVSLDGVLDIVLPALHAEGLLLMQLPTSVGPEPALRTVIYNVEDPEDYVDSTMLLVLEKDNPQGQGSGLTYAKRYAILSMLGLTADKDDDGEAASQSTAPRKTKVTRMAVAAVDTDADGEPYRF